MNVLLIDDDIDLAESLKRFLSLYDIQTEAVTTVRCAEARLRQEAFDTVLLDVMLPDQSGFDFLPKLRSLTNVPVFMLTALGEEDHLVTGFELGADDYITKPFSAKELVARLRAQRRRQRLDHTEQKDYTYDDLRLIPNQHKVIVAGRNVDLTGAECEILLHLICAPRHSESREFLSQNVLGRGASPMDRSLDVHVSNLRRKLGPHPVKGNRIRSQRGRGYVLA